ncbi:hypothetical protein ACF087_34395 [Streptomyces goshikiensis]|uniref:hypothetical protein n=1 Tax=Streptomyces goshikiensis TaxID=1942 RepID=UPI0036F9E11E
MIADESGGDQDGPDDGDVLILQMLLDGVHIGPCHQQVSAFIDVVSDLLRLLGRQPPN